MFLVRFVDAFFHFLDPGQAARRLLGKFEVLLREDCLSTDLPLLGPYIGRIISANEATAMTRCV